MSEETQEQQEQIAAGEKVGVEDVVSYIEQKISHQKRLIQRREKGQVGPLLSPEKVQEVQVEIERLEKMKEAVAREEYRGAAAELQKDITVEENILAGWKQELTKELTGDDKYFELKQKIMSGQEVLGKATDESSKTWITGVINEFKERQGNTERGRVLGKMEETQARKDHLQVLQKVASPPAPASP